MRYEEKVLWDSLLRTTANIKGNLHCWDHHHTCLLTSHRNSLNSESINLQCTCLGPSKLCLAQSMVSFFWCRCRNMTLFVLLGAVWSGLHPVSSCVSLPSSGRQFKYQKTPKPRKFQTLEDNTKENNYSWIWAQHLSVISHFQGFFFLFFILFYFIYFYFYFCIIKLF
jgi:hypothetical protein